MNRIRIDLLTPPFAGHLHPILGIAKILQGEYEVRVLTTPRGLAAVQAAGLPGVALLAGCEERLTTLVNTPVPVGSNPAKLLRQFSQALVMQRQVREELRVLYASSRPSLVIADFTLAAAGIAAQELGISWWTTLPSPCVLEGGNSPPSYFGGLAPRDGLTGYLRDKGGWLAVRLFKRLIAMLYRRQLRAMGIEKIYRADGSEAAYSNERLLVLGSQHIEFRSDWPAHARLVPPLLYTPPSANRAPDFVLGQCHVLVTLGTHLKFAKQQFAEAIKAVAQDMPEVIFHFTEGSDEPGEIVSEGNFSRYSYINYADMLGRYSLVVHHGGSGVLYHCLRAGCPAVVFPVDYDQFDNASRLERAGAAIWARRIKDLKPAVARGLADPSLKARCLELARQLDLNADPVIRAELASWAYAQLRTTADPRSVRIDPAAVA